MTLKDGSQIETGNMGSEAGGTLVVSASELIEATGAEANNHFPTRILAQVYSGAKIQLIKLIKLICFKVLNSLFNRSHLSTFNPF